MGGILFRGLLHLKGKSVTGLDAKTILCEVEKEYSVKLDFFSVLNHLRHNKSPAISVLAFTGMILESLNVLVRTVDAMNGAA